jgi:hypothetical protein
MRIVPLLDYYCSSCGKILRENTIIEVRLVTKMSMIRLAFTEAFELTAIICSVIALILAVLAFLFLPRKQANADVGTSIIPIAEW